MTPKKVANWPYKVDRRWQQEESERIPPPCLELQKGISGRISFCCIFTVIKTTETRYVRNKITFLNF